MKTYYINLDRKPDRKKVMEEMYTDLIRISAYDGNLINTYTDIVIPSNLHISKYELGCTLSHIRAIVTAYKNGDNEVLIMEDDIYDTYKSLWNKKISDIVFAAPSDTECIQLHCINSSEVVKMIDMTEDYSRWCVGPQVFIM